jgi:hypothetical protein
MPASSDWHNMSEIIFKYRAIIPFLIVTAFLNFYLQGMVVDTQQPGLAEAKFLEGSINGIPARDNKFRPVEALRSLPSDKDFKGRLIIWIGNSQQHAINQPRPGDEVASVVLHKSLNGNVFPGDNPAFGMSYPNLSMSEIFLLTFALVTQQKEKCPGLIVLGVRFQDTKQLGLRSDFRELFDLPDIEKDLSSFLASVDADNAIQDITDEMVAYQAVKNERKTLEHRLSKITGSLFPLFREKDTIYNWLMIKLYMLRNFALGIRTDTKRPLLESRYQTAMQYLELTLNASKRARVPVFVYNIPLRPGNSSPYILSEYQHFREAVSSLCFKYNVKYRDYDGLIPLEEWGSTQIVREERDYMHFTGAGHKRLARQVKNDIAEFLLTNVTAAK